MKIDVDVVDNSAEVLSEMETKVQQALNAVGMTAERYAADGCPVDTGRLKGSINYATKTKMSGGKDSTPKGTPEDNAAYIGTNVEYAPFVELGTSRMKPRPFIKTAVVNHDSEYKEMIKDILTN